MSSARANKVKIGRFTLTSKIGSGGQGTVYLAADPKLKRSVAIKVIDKDPFSNAESELELPNEALMAARLQHPNIVAIHDVGYYGTRPYMVFEYIKGHTFREIITRDGALAESRALALMRSVLEGMAHAHERQVLHLDLNPRNLLLSDRDVVQIMDFGLARLTHAVTDVTTVPVGTMLYLAPEQLEERPPTPHTDVRSLGLILFELLLGRSAIEARTIHKAASEILQFDIDLTAIASKPFMAPIAAFLSGALARDPTQRFADAGQMLIAFDAAVRESETLRANEEAPAQGTVEFLLRRMQRRKDFPALSRSLVEINRLTSRDSNATTTQLAAVVLRDYALTNKLLKLANSAFYGVVAGEVKNISHAISLLGFEQLRITANSLTLFSHIRDRNKSGAMRELQVRSFTAGLLARHLAQRQKMNYAEEAFICGMFQTLGETLTMFYFAEEMLDIEQESAKQNISLTQAAKQVLGISFSQLGAAVMQEWRFPGLYVDAVRGIDASEELPAPQNEEERLRNVACFTDELCRILGSKLQASLAIEQMTEAHTRYRHALNFDASLIPSMVTAALDRLDQHAGILGINTGQSAWCAAARASVEEPEEAAEPEDQEVTDVTMKIERVMTPADAAHTNDRSAHGAADAVARRANP